MRCGSIYIIYRHTQTRIETMESNAIHTFRPHASFGGDYIESDTLNGMITSLRQHLPGSVRFRAIKVPGDDFHTVIFISHYFQGPTIAGYYRQH